MVALIFIALFLVITVTTTLARRAALRLRDETTRRLAVAKSGVIPGAEPFELRQGADAPAVLLVHGGGDTPQTLRYLAEFLYGRGFTVSAPLLPGHGRTLIDFSRVDADSWLTAVRSAYQELKVTSRWVALAGLSMGGALAAQVAAEDHDLPVLVLLAPYLAMPPHIALAARISRLWNPAVPYVRALNPKARRSIQDESEAARSLGYGVFTTAALRALHTTVARGAAALSRITSPTLMIQSREDNRMPPDVAQRRFDRIGAREKQLIWLAGAGHVITVDFGKERVFALVADWLESHGAQVARQRRA